MKKKKYILIKFDFLKFYQIIIIWTIIINFQLNIKQYNLMLIRNSQLISGI